LVSTTPSKEGSLANAGFTAYPRCAIFMESLPGMSQKAVYRVFKAFYIMLHAGFSLCAR
jgi:hypothetical protein